MLCTISFLPCSLIKDYELKQTVTRKQAKFTLMAEAANSNTEYFIKAVNCEDSVVTNHFTINNLIATFSLIGNPFSLFHLNIISLSFQVDELESLISESKRTLK